MEHRIICKEAGECTRRKPHYRFCCVDCREFEKCKMDNNKSPCVLAKTFRMKSFEPQIIDAYDKNSYSYCFKKLISRLSEKNKKKVIAILI